VNDQSALEALYGKWQTLGMRPINPYLTQPAQHTTLPSTESPNLQGMTEETLHQFIPEEKRPILCSGGTLFGASALPSIAEKLQRAANEDKPQEDFVKASKCTFSESCFKARKQPREMLVVDMLSFPFTSSTVSQLKDEGCQPGKVWKALRIQLSQQPGFQQLYWGTQEEDLVIVQLFIIWKTKSDQDIFRSSNHHPEIWEPLLPFLSQPVALVPIWSIPNIPERAIA